MDWQLGGWKKNKSITEGTRGGGEQKSTAPFLHYGLERHSVCLKYSDPDSDIIWDNQYVVSPPPGWSLLTDYSVVIDVVRGVPELQHFPPTILSQLCRAGQTAKPQTANQQPGEENCIIKKLILIAKYGL